jgi:hypothetical protein
VRFSVKQPLEVARAVAEDALVDPDFYASMGASGPIDTPVVLWRSDEGEAVRMAVRYRFTGSLARPARAVLDPHKLTWVIESTMHRAHHDADFVMRPDHYADRLDCTGRYRFEEGGGPTVGCVQVIEGELRVHVPLVAGAVERAIVSGLRQHMAEHARHLAHWARERSRGG